MAVIDSLVNKLAQIMEQNASLILGIKDQVEDLRSDLVSFRAILRQASRHEAARGDEETEEVLKDVVDKIRTLVNEAEDAIDRYLVETMNYQSKGVVRKCLEMFAYYSKANDAAKQIEGVRRKIDKIRRDNDHSLRLLQSQPNTAQLFLQRKDPIVEEDDVVGFDEEARIIKGRLQERSSELNVISIVGMAGLGKTTLTKMVFNNRELQYEFFISLWVYVSRTFNRRQIFLNILSNFTDITKDHHDQMTDHQLAQRIRESLKDKKYFVVVDDVWSEQDWDDLKTVFPDNKKGSRILLTTRDHPVAMHADSSRCPHRLKFLTSEESWVLLERKAFHGESSPLELKEPGTVIAVKCNGLPLAIVVIAGVLDKECTYSKWKQVAEDPFPQINQEHQNYHKLVKLSYDHLSNSNTKDCFLYIAAFPIGHSISAWKLMRLWIAEGFIPPTEGGYTSDLERTAEKYLQDLVDRNLLMVLNRGADGQIKTCRVHDTLHEFCKAEAGKNNLFHEINSNRLEDIETYRRLCVPYSSITNFMDKKLSGEHIRSFLSSSSKDIIVQKNYCSTIPKNFPTLRVLDIEYLRFPLLSKEFYSLFYLKYLAISTDLNVLPEKFTHLWNMQTLVFNTSQNGIKINADIWSMTKLRHVLFNVSAQLPQPSRKRKADSPGPAVMELQTLSTISPDSCTEEILSRVPSLRKLGIRGNLSELLESNSGGTCSFDSIHRLEYLENLKLLHVVALGQASKLRSIPRADKFPRRLRKLTLSNTSFEWKDMDVMGMLEELEILKLEENAFRGEFWDLSSNVVFKHLKFLRIQRTDLVYWTASKNSFPVLKLLHLKHCVKLVAVPCCFGEVESLKVMELFCSNPRAAFSAHEIQRRLEGRSRFVLSIYPPDQVTLPL